MILITFLKCIRSSSQFSRVLLVSAIPASIFWSFGFGLSFFFQFLFERFGVAASSQFIHWLNSWSPHPEFVFCYMVLRFHFRWVLGACNLYSFERRTRNRHSIRRDLLKEAEMERSRLMERQKIELEKTVVERTAELKHSLENLNSHAGSTGAT